MHNCHACAGTYLQWLTNYQHVVCWALKVIMCKQYRFIRTTMSMHCVNHISFDNQPNMDVTYLLHRTIVMMWWCYWTVFNTGVCINIVSSYQCVVSIFCLVIAWAASPLRAGDLALVQSAIRCYHSLLKSHPDPDLSDYIHSLPSLVTQGTTYDIQRWVCLQVYCSPFTFEY